MGGLLVNALLAIGLLVLIVLVVYLVDRVKTETDLPVRNRMLTEALQLQNDTVAHIPLHNQVIPWAMKKNVDVVHRADNRLDWALIKVN